ncbi:hypothetical protein K491DRAFT_760368 [Lophiostoma macrostomum CBS 122681]|uniref:WD40 repeat-like protein n=1 Tax=Lophiostoma macrostomum CBS 122681 TaxID=1314788 RepID=A0A6A6SZF2_9PLEO|nr:hypothetical protein K491DRAFT_760368 [Lophiostoma macrostomum CBS 122681]
MDDRISCTATGIQRGFHPVADRKGPFLNAWRCEITGLSETHNLYFIALRDLIYVYLPKYPDQSLSEEPALIIHPPVSAPNLPGYINLRHPHSINRLHIDFLGREEVVIVACDDGDVVGYHVSAIQRAVETAAAGTNGDAPIPRGIEPRTFFHTNLKDSAWGIAIHREARMIAFSANTAIVTVIAFALTGKLDEHEQTLEDAHGITNTPWVSFNNTGSDPEGRWLFSGSIDGRTWLWEIRRSQAPRVIQIGECPWAMDPAEAPGDNCRCEGLRRPGSIRTPVSHAVWAAMFIDPRSCRWSASEEDAFGMAPEKLREHNHYATGNPYFWRIQPPLLQFPSTSADDHTPSGLEDSPSGSLLPGTADDEPLILPGSIPNLTVAGTSGSDDDGEDGSTTEGSNDGEDTLDSPGLFQGLVVDPPVQHSQQPSAAPGLFVPESTNESAGAGTAVPSVTADSDTESDPGELPIIEGSSDDDDSDDSVINLVDYNAAAVQAYLFEHGTSILMAKKRLYYEVGTIEKPGAANPSRTTYADGEFHRHSTKRPVPAPYTPYMIITKSEIYLLQPESRTPPRLIPCGDTYLRTPTSSTTPPSPIIVLSNPLYPHADGAPDSNASATAPTIPKPGHITHLPRQPDPNERLNYVQHIPELGIVVVASFGGRCAILSLSVMGSRSSGSGDDDGKGSGSGSSSKGEQGPSTSTRDKLYGFRTEHLLPFPAQEREMLRGGFALGDDRRVLVGVSVGPVQGCFDVSEDGEEDEQDDGDSDTDAGGSSSDEDMDVEVEVDSDGDEEEGNGKSSSKPSPRPTRTTRTARPAAAAPNPKNGKGKAKFGGKGKGRSVEGRRWRLMMLFQDMTVLSYELSRSRPKGETPGLAELVV